MAKHKKKDKKGKAKDRQQADVTGDPVQAELARLRLENEHLRARLERIAELARTPLGTAEEAGPDIEDEEYDELSRDLDDIGAAEPQPASS